MVMCPERGWDGVGKSIKRVTVGPDRKEGACQGAWLG